MSDTTDTWTDVELVAEARRQAREMRAYGYSPTADLLASLAGHLQISTAKLAMVPWACPCGVVVVGWQCAKCGADKDQALSLDAEWCKLMADSNHLEASTAKLIEIRKLVAWVSTYASSNNAVRDGFDINHYNLADEVLMILDEKEVGDD